MKRILNYTFIILLLSFTGTTCSNVAPDDTKITINPSSFEIKGLAEEWLNQSFEITVRNEDEEPLNDVEITIQFTFAAGFNCPSTAPTCPFATLLDENRNPVDSPFTTKTKEDGKYTVWVNYWRGEEWKGTLDVSSGTAFASASFEVKQ